MSPIVAAYAPPVSSASEFFPLFYFRSQFLGFYLSNTRSSSSLAGLRAYCARISPLADTVLASSRSYLSAPSTTGGGSSSVPISVSPSTSSGSR
jgi:hypothetical protein